MSWNLKQDGVIGILELDVPDTEVNVLTTENLTELKEILLEIDKRSDLKALLITSAKSRIFVAGADIKEIRGISTEQDAYDKAEQGKQVFQVLEDLKIPTITVINGACLGGGYELALSTDFRVASFADRVKIGLPESNLGILPGFGGSIRLPRLIGLLQAMPLILAGKIVSSQDALKKGMVDRLFPANTLLENAIAFANEIIQKGAGKIRKKRRKNMITSFLEDTPIGRSIVFSKASKDILKKTKGFYPAPLQIIELFRKTYNKSTKQAYEQESKDFSKLGATQVSKNLISLFFMNEKYKKFKWTQTKLVPSKIKKCGVVGAGIMGGGIAQRVSYRNIPVKVKDINETALSGALKEAKSIYDGALKRRRIKRHEAEFKMGLISVGLTNDGLKNADIIIEAVVEDMKIKQKVFSELSGFVADDTILASNTSSLSVTKMAEVAKNPERVVGVHFFNPVHRMPLVEIIRASQTSDETVERAVSFARELGKTVIVVKDDAGFLVNRLLLPYLNEAAYLMQEGMSPEAIDKIATDFGMPMGPVELVDQVGIDVGYKVAHILYKAFGKRMQVASILEQVYNDGLLGKKSNNGFYIYQGREKKINPKVKLGTDANRTSSEDALKRMIYIMINEAARCLEENVIDSADTVDIGMTMGTGFPPFRAGLLHYADSVGLANILSDLKRFQDGVDVERFEPSPLLVKLAGENKTFH